MQSARSSAKPTVTVSSAARYVSEAARLRAVLLHSMEHLGIGAASVDLSVIGDAAMRKINRETRGKDEPTDVLSFENLGFPSGPSAARYLGEIVIAPQSAARKEHATEHLAVHGLLHLLGYTHEGARDTIAMEKIEKRILTHLAHVTRNHRA